MNSQLHPDIVDGWNKRVELQITFSRSNYYSTHFGAVGRRSQNAKMNASQESSTLRKTYYGTRVGRIRRGGGPA